MLTGTWSNRGAHALLVGTQYDTANLEVSLAVSYKTEIPLSYDLVVVLLDIYLEELKMYVHTKTCTQCLQQFDS